jgi:hypothetical protein
MIQMLRVVASRKGDGGLIRKLFNDAVYIIEFI